MVVPQPVALRAGRLAGVDRDDLVVDLDRRVRMGEQVVVPLRMVVGRRPSRRRSPRRRRRGDTSTIAVRGSPDFAPVDVRIREGLAGHRPARRASAVGTHVGDQVAGPGFRIPVHVRTSCHVAVPPGPPDRCLRNDATFRRIVQAAVTDPELDRPHVELDERAVTLDRRRSTGRSTSSPTSARWRSPTPAIGRAVERRRSRRRPGRRPRPRGCRRGAGRPRGRSGRPEPLGQRAAAAAACRRRSRGRPAGPGRRA